MMIRRSRQSIRAWRRWQYHPNSGPGNKSGSNPDVPRGACTDLQNYKVFLKSASIAEPLSRCLPSCCKANTPMCDCRPKTQRSALDCEAFLRYARSFSTSFETSTFAEVTHLTSIAKELATFVAWKSSSLSGLPDRGEKHAL